jgi:hypothetical protein
MPWKKARDRVLSAPDAQELFMVMGLLRLLKHCGSVFHIFTLLKFSHARQITFWIGKSRLSRDFPKGVNDSLMLFAHAAVF